MTERNDPCPCGSGKKYKLCFGRELETCALYAQHKKQEKLVQHKDKDDRVFLFFKEVLEDVGTVFIRNDKEKELVSSRMQMIAVFTLTDIIAGYWFAYRGVSGTPTQRFTEWMNRYCFVKENSQYPNSVFVEIDTERFFELRNSLVHFFGLASGAHSEHSFAISPNEDARWNPVTEKLIKILKKKGQKVTVIESKKFHNLVIEGATLMLEEWKNVIKESEKDEGKKMSHVEGIDRIFQRIEIEGAFKIQMPEEKSGN